MVLPILGDWVGDSSWGGFPEGGDLSISVTCLPERFRRIRGVMVGMALRGTREIEIRSVDEAFFTPLYFTACILIYMGYGGGSMVAVGLVD